MDASEARKRIAKLSEKKFDIVHKAENEYREMNREELEIVAEIEGAIEAVTKELPERPLTWMGPNAGISHGSGAAFDLKGPRDKKDWYSLFGDRGGHHWQDNKTNFLSAMFSGRFHPELIRASMAESAPSDGGMLVPSETAARIHAVSLENELVMPRAYLQPMASNTIKIPAMVVGNHGTALFGGFTASYVGELGTIAEHDPKTRSMELTAKKLTGLIRFSSELNADTPSGMAQIEQLCGKGLAWYRDRSFLKGSGATEPVGILKSDCVVTVGAESGQRKNTIVYENLIKMMARLYAGSFSNSVWVAHQSTIPQLLSLSIAVGTGGSFIPVMIQTNGEFSILTRPVLFTEKTETLGTKGDIMLCDFSQYVIGLRSEMRFDYSPHVAFTTDEILARIISRFDGQSLWNEPLTLADGTTTVSPFVVLADRLT